jgi:hypothetical protein
VNKPQPETAWLESAVHAPTEDLDTVIRAAADRALTEDLALALLRRRDLPAQVVEALGKNLAVARLRTVRYALITHQRTPRHISLPLLRHLYPFELMKLAVVPHLAADLKRAAEEALITKSASLSSGERLALAKQGSSRIAAEMLLDSEPRVTSAALGNPRLTEAGVVLALSSPKSPPHLAPAVCHHSQWRLRNEVRTAALRSEFTPLAHAIDFASRIPLAQLKDVLSQSKLSEQVKQYLLQIAEKHTSGNRVRSTGY